MHKYLTEFIGTFFLVLTIGLAVNKAGNFAPLAIGASLMVMVYMGGHISGAHYNPAVSLAVFLRGKLALNDFIVYVGVQLAGGLAAAYAAFMIVAHPVDIKPALSSSFADLFGALLVEFLYTFALALVVLNAATAKKTEGNSFYGLAIGFTVAAAAFAGGSISGGAFNPAVGTGLTLVNAEGGSGTYQFLWLYWVGPLAGGALAALVFNVQEAGSTAS